MAERHLEAQAAVDGRGLGRSAKDRGIKQVDGRTQQSYCRYLQGLQHLPKAWAAPRIQGSDSDRLLFFKAKWLVARNYRGRFDCICHTGFDAYRKAVTIEGGESRA